jgi:hypothetical protein
MRLAFCILLILPIFHFALVAPVAVGEMLEVRSNAIGVRKDEMAAWKKRMDSDSGNYAALAVEGGHAYDSGGNSDNDEEGDEEGFDAEGVREEDTDGGGAKSDDENEGSRSDSDSGGNGSGDGGGGDEADGDDDHANDNDHSGHDSSFTSLSEVPRPATPERTTDLGKMISAVKNILTFGSRVKRS